MTNIPGTKRPDNAINRGSLYIEKIRWPDPNDKRPTLEGEPEVLRQLAVLIEAADSDFTPEDAWEAVQHYGRNYVEGAGVAPSIAFGIFVDGLMHGIAASAGLSATAEEAGY